MSETHARHPSSKLGFRNDHRTTGSLMSRMVVCIISQEVVAKCVHQCWLAYLPCPAPLRRMHDHACQGFRQRGQAGPLVPGRPVGGPCGPSRVAPILARTAGRVAWSSSV
eukprot:2202053-Alexandrium_andersonii.AAC.1